MANDSTIYKLGLITQKKQELQSLQIKVRSYRESINHLFFKYPFDLEKIDIKAVCSLQTELVNCLEQYCKLHAEIEELQG